LSEEIRAKDKHIKQNEFKNALIEGKIKSTNVKLKQKDEQIKSQQLKIYELQSKLENRKDNLKEYFQSEICVKILNEINELSKSGRMTSELNPLSQEEFAILLQTANLHLGEFIKYLSERYPSLKKEDLYYLCLIIIGLNDKQIAALFNVTYNAIRSRRKKICTLLGIDINENIYKKFLL
jgi:DNA-binding CsgD family transcriptional regulator